MKTQQLALETFGAKMAPAAHIQDEDLVLCCDFAPAQFVRAATL
jgi:hypothetical protein